MKKSFRGRSTEKSKDNKKDIRNARGLKETVGGRSSSSSSSAHELSEFIRSRKKTADDPAESPASARKWRKSVEPMADEDEGPESRATRDSIGNPGSYYMWTADGPAPVKADSKPSRRGEGLRHERRNGNIERTNVESKKIENNEFENKKSENKNHKSAPAGKDVVRNQTQVYSRTTEVQKIFRPNERLRTEERDDEHGRDDHGGQTKRRERDAAYVAGKFDDGGDKDEDLSSEARSSKRGKNRKGKKVKGGRDPHIDKPGKPEKNRPNAPIYFDKHEDRKTARARQARTAAAEARYVTGIVKRHPDGFGFVISDIADTPDVYVPRNYMTGVMTNDRVKVEVYSAKEADRVFGEIKEILSRAYSRVVGVYLPVDMKYGVILGEGKGWGCDLRIAAADTMNAKEGDLVAVEVTSYPTPQTEFSGRVVEIIGDIEEPLNDIKRVVFAQGIPNEFSEQAIRDAEKYGPTVTEQDTKGRVDLRNQALITIDGATARDFDDAVFVEQYKDSFRLWVAIADVSHYVKPDTKLNDEAYARGTSTYFPNFVVPMLPEALSNELCSLNPDVDRLCFVCEMEIDLQGNLSSYKFYEGVMKSKARVTYGEAQEVLDGRIPPRIKHVAEHIRLAGDLAKILMAKRFREGSLDLEIPETQVVVNEAGETVDIVKSQRLFAHRLIEELMLVTNICTARFMTENNLPGIYRIHEEPFDENIENLQRFLFNFGGSRSMGNGKLQKKITRALQSFEGKPEAQILNILTLRTMQQAKYSQANVGHFGLGFSHYSHFTSPIRRFPDLLAHRQIKSFIYPAYRKDGLNEEEIASAAIMLSACEQRSVKAERQIISIKKARFIGGFVGDEFDGIISGVVKFGIFVLLRSYDVDGLVKIEELGDDRFIFDDQNLRLVGKRTGISFNIGDAVRVQVVSVDAEVGRVEFRLVGVTSSESASGTKKNRKDIQKRGPSKNDRGRSRKERISKRRGKA